MKQYDVKCPVCGHVNHNLFLEETDGWMECEECSSMSRSNRFGETVRIPIIAVNGHCKSAVLHA